MERRQAIRWIRSQNKAEALMHQSHDGSIYYGARYPSRSVQEPTTTYIGCSTRYSLLTTTSAGYQLQTLGNVSLVPDEVEDADSHCTEILPQPHFRIVALTRVWLTSGTSHLERVGTRQC